MFLRLDCDFGGEGLWDACGRMVSVESVPISRDLATIILAWQLRFELNAKPWSASDTFNYDAHAEHQLTLARRIKRELPDYVIAVGNREMGLDGALSGFAPLPNELR